MTRPVLHKSLAEVSRKDAETVRAYEDYFDSGFYDARYPAPNQTVWRRIEAFLGSKTSVLDFGCGSGRYLFRLKGRVARAVGFDISPAALAMLRERVDGLDWDEVAILGPNPDDLAAHITKSGRMSLVLCLFGVLGHITDPATRAGALGQIRTTLQPGQGRLLVSVPNKARRFRNEQAAGAEGSLVTYSRTHETGKITLHYQLFDTETFQAELEAAGFTVHRLSCESVLPESWLLHSAPLRWIDAILTPLCPARWGYGLLAEASC